MKKSLIASVICMGLFWIQPTYAGLLGFFKPKRPIPVKPKTNPTKLGILATGLNGLATTMFVVDYANAKSAEASPNYKNCEEVFHEGQVLVVCQKEE